MTEIEISISAIDLDGVDERAHDGAAEDDDEQAET